MKLQEIADDILAHLHRLEADESWNKSRRYDSKTHQWIEETDSRRGEKQVWHPSAYVGGRFVYVRYVSYQNNNVLTKSQAIKYLEWLEAGNKGKHYKVPGIDE